MESRNIVLVNERDPRNPRAGGAEVHVFEIFKRFVERGHRVSLLAAGFPGCLPSETIDGIRVRRLVNRYLFYAALPFALRRLVRREQVDVVIDVLNKVPFFSPWTVATPSFAIVHHLMGATAFRQAAFPVALATWSAEKMIPRCYSRVPLLAISPSTRADLIARGVPGERIRVVPPGIDQARYVPPESRSSRPLVLWIGRIEPYKHAEHILRAMVRVGETVPDARLVVVGEGSAQPRLAALASELGLEDAVSFTGFIGEEEKIGYLQRAKVVVNTSEKEGWGLTVIEANACGVASVSSDVEGLRDSVVHGRTGLLYPFGDVPALAGAVTSLLVDEELRERLAAEAREWSKRFVWENIVADVEAIMEEAIDPTASTSSISASRFFD